MKITCNKSNAHLMDIGCRSQGVHKMKMPMIRSLTFQDGNAEVAMNFYLELFDNTRILNINR